MESLVSAIKQKLYTLEGDVSISGESGTKITRLRVQKLISVNSQKDVEKMVQEYGFEISITSPEGCTTTIDITNPKRVVTQKDEIIKKEELKEVKETDSGWAWVSMIKKLNLFILFFSIGFVLFTYKEAILTSLRKYTM